MDGSCLQTITQTTRKIISFKNLSKLKMKKKKQSFKKENKKEIIAIIGMGYVGLPLALRTIEKGYKTIGIDLDKKKIEIIKKGKSPFKEEFIEERMNLLKKLQATTNLAMLKKADIVIICVPTPVDNQCYPDLGPIKNAVASVIKNNKKGQLVIMESTINPGVCEEIVEPLFAEARLKEGKDYYLAHCPERIDPGKVTVSTGYDVGNIARVVGSLSKIGLKRAKKFYESIIDAKIKPMKSIREAEAVKVVENSFRDVNIAFANELAQSFDKMGIDLKDVIDGAATKPFGFMPFRPTCGVGGHCIPVDPYYLIERAKKSGFDHHFLRKAREINRYMPEYTVKILQNLLNEVGLPLKKTPIALLGLSYKENVDDLRESPSLVIEKILREKGAKVVRFDPYFPKLSDAKTLTQALRRSEAVVLATHHQEFLDLDSKEFKKKGTLVIVDGRNCLNSNKIKRLGIKYHGIGSR